MSDVSSRPMEVRPYHLFSDHGPARNRMSVLEPTLERINDRFGRFLRAALLQHLRRGVEIAPNPIELIRHRDLLDQLPSPTHMTFINMKPLRGNVLIIFDTPLVVAIVESRFGGNGKFPIETQNHEFTPFELKSMRRVVEATLEQFALAWEPFGAFEPEIARHETNPQFGGFATSEELIIVSRFEFRVDQGRGRMMTCIPYSALEPVQEQLTSVVEEAVDQDLRWAEALRRHVAQASITLSVDLGAIEISLGELAALRPGTIYEMDRPESLVVASGGVPLFRGRWGRHGRRIGVRIDECLTPVAEPAAAGRLGHRMDANADE